MKIATVIGARPQFIKAAPVSRTLSATSGLEEVVVDTGQHYDWEMSTVFFEEFDIPKPAYHLGIGGGSHGQNTGRMLEGVETVLHEEKPDVVLVYGDTDSTLAGALAAAKMRIPIAHVEAGLRSYNRRMPEELNRVLTDQLSTVLFCPTSASVANLQKEGFPHPTSQQDRQRIVHVGDVMYDAALQMSDLAERKRALLKTLQLRSKEFILSTVHRAENTDQPSILRYIMDALAESAEELPVVLSLHPRTRKRLDAEGIRLSDRITVTQPLGYLDLVMLVKHAAVVATDSGGLQKEAFFHGTPCVTLREETEWVELLEMGWNRLAPPTEPDMTKRILEAVGSRGVPGTPYGNGDASKKIVDILTE